MMKLPQCFASWYCDRASNVGPFTPASAPPILAPIRLFFSSTSPHIEVLMVLHTVKTQTFSVPAKHKGAQTQKQNGARTTQALPKRKPNGAHQTQHGSHKTQNTNKWNKKMGIVLDPLQNKFNVSWKTREKKFKTSMKTFQRG